MSTRQDERSPAQYGHVVLYLLAAVGAMSILAGLLPKHRFELDYAGHAMLVKSSWWGLRERRYGVRLQKHSEWKRGVPYRPPLDFDDYDWFIKGKGDEWFPLEFEEPPDWE